VWSSGDPTIAPSGGTFLHGDRWKGWDRALAMAVLKDHHLRVLKLSTTGNGVITHWVRITDRGRLRVAVLNHTNNNLYIATDADPGRILRVIPG
jgi:glucose/arabinose dehydrogenase